MVSMVSIGSLVRWYHPSGKLRAVRVWTQPPQVPIGQPSFFDWFSGPGDGVGGGEGPEEEEEGLYLRLETRKRLQTNEAKSRGRGERRLMSES